MRRLPRGRLASLLLAGLALTLLPTICRAQAPKAQKILLETFDKVQLQGTWYPTGGDGPKSPVVIFLHKIGGNRQQDGWESLAQALQEKGFAVLSFDFRGHGDSKTVKPEFWGLSRSNINGIKGANFKKESIDWKEFTPAYYGMLVNDIAAAKVAIEQKNNARECNSNDVYIVGAEDGAALGLLWMASEWGRHKLGFNMAGAKVFNKDPEGKDLAGFVGLSLRQTLGARGTTVPLSSLFNNNYAKMREMPICLFYGDEDANAKAAASTIYDKILGVNEKTKDKYKLTYKLPLEKTKLAGHELLGKKTLDLESNIAKYLGDKVKDARPAKVWFERDVSAEGKLNLNPLVQVPLAGFGINVP